jgi:hypothetical protein
MRRRVESVPGHFSQSFEKYKLFEIWRLGTKLEWLSLTPSTPSFAIHHQNFDIAELGLPQRARLWPRDRTFMS